MMMASNSNNYVGTMVLSGYKIDDSRSWKQQQLADSSEARQGERGEELYDDGLYGLDGWMDGWIWDFEICD